MHYWTIATHLVLVLVFLLILLRAAVFRKIVRLNSYWDEIWQGCFSSKHAWIDRVVIVCILHKSLEIDLLSSGM